MKMLASSLAVLALTLGCAGPEIHYDYDAKATFQNYRTYDWYAPAKGDKTRGAGQNPIADTRVRRAVETELDARKIRKETSADPDFLLTYYPVYQARKGHRARLGMGLGLPGLGVGVSAPVGAKPTGKIGSIVLEVQDFKTHTLVWKAVADGVLDDTETPEDADQSVAEAVKKMLKRFPISGS